MDDTWRLGASDIKQIVIKVQRLTKLKLRNRVIVVIELAEYVCKRTRNITYPLGHMLN